jgi:hypothetical protein
MFSFLLLVIAGVLAFKWFGVKGAIIIFAVAILISIIMHLYGIKFTIKLESEKLGFETHLTIGHGGIHQ